jgi:hypothetical protein
MRLIVNRTSDTLRKWEEYNPNFPEHLHAHRDERGWRYWTPEQAEEIKIWMQGNLKPIGWNLPTLKDRLTEEQVDAAIKLMRRPRPRQSEIMRERQPFAEINEIRKQKAASKKSGKG